MYSLKSIARRGTTLTAAIALAVSAVVPAVVPAGQAFADALNPLTKRSLTLSSSSPGWSHTDGSGNSTYAPPNSGANGQKTGNTFSFSTSSDSTSNKIKTMSFQYCTTSAGDCLAPGNNGWTGTAGSMTRNADSASTSDLNIVTSSPTEVSSSDFGSVVDTAGSTNPVAGTGTITTNTTDGAVVGVGTNFDTELSIGSTITTAGSNTYTVSAIADATHMTVDTTPTTAEPGVAFTYNQSVAATGNVKTIPEAGIAQDVTAGTANNTIAGDYVVYYYDTTSSTWKISSDWAMSTANVETNAVVDGEATGAQNYIILTNDTGLGIPADTAVKVVFFANDTNYITNPGAGAFFVKINTYDQKFVATSPTAPDVDLTGLEPVSDANVIDGGVTVANVMNQSIQITTKVLETMQFSVGTVDPDNLTSDGTTTSQLHTANGNTSHGPCDPVVMSMTGNASADANVLAIGDQSAESSLSTDATYSTHSYWRLSSNSSAGATVYYSGSTLSNTEGDQINAIGATASAPLRGSPQFGLAIANGTVADNGTGPYTVKTAGIENNSTQGAFENGADNGANTLNASFATDMAAGSYTYHNPQLWPLVPAANYQYGAGVINGSSGTFTGYGTPNTQFAFDANSATIPVAIATESSQVVDCVTAKMRYIANIAATTPAGIYTTKVNYIAAPQY